MDMEDVVEARYGGCFGDQYGDDADSLFHQASLRIGNFSTEAPRRRGLPVPQNTVTIIETRGSCLATMP